MFFKREHNDDRRENAALQEFKRLWNEELVKKVDYRDFSKAYNYALRKRQIKDYCMRTYFDFSSENSARFKEACDSFDDGDILWTFMLIRQFASIPGQGSALKNLTNKRRTFLSDKRKASVITRHSVRMFLYNMMKNSFKSGEKFVEEALSDNALYEQYKNEGKYKSAYKIAALTDKSGDYAHNMKKYLYYVAKRPITEENLEQTHQYFKYVERYYNFKRKKKDGSYVIVNDIDTIIAMLIFIRNGGDISRDEYIKKVHRTVKVYCTESYFFPICLFADYLYQVGELELEQLVLKLLVYYGEAIDEKYKKRYTCLELMSKNSNKFIFRHEPHTPIECISFDSKKENFADVLKESINKKDKNTWCIVIKSHFKTYEFNYKYFYDDRLLSTLETIFDNEFGEYVLEYSIRTYFSGDNKNNARHSMIIITSGKNQYADFPKIAIMIKLEPITKKMVNMHYCTLYLPEEVYTEEEIIKDSEYVKTILTDTSDSRFSTFSNVIENLTWNTINGLIGK